MPVIIQYSRMICHAEILETIEPIVLLEVSMRRLAENGKSSMFPLINNNHKVEEHHPCNAMRHEARHICWQLSN